MFEVPQHTALHLWEVPANLSLKRGPQNELRSQSANDALLSALRCAVCDLCAGKEGIVRNVDASVVKAFYERWYQPEVRRQVPHDAACMGNTGQRLRP